MTPRALRTLRKVRVELDRRLYGLLMLLRVLAHDPVWIGFRALRLLSINPHLFARRVAAILSMFMSDPAASAGAVRATRKRRVEIERGYQVWLAERAASPPASAGRGPLLSIIMPVYNTDERLLEETIQSVRRQTYARWELCIADDASTVPGIRPLLENHERADSRIRVSYRQATGHISAASNSALTLAGGEFVVLLDHDDLLSPDALAVIAGAANEDPRIDFIYSDEDKIDEEGKRSQPFFKPAWSPTLLSTCNYITHLSAIRRSLVLDVGGFRDEMVGSQDHDLFLRVTERARMIAHIPDVLYSWRMTPDSTSRTPTAKPYALNAAKRALEDAVGRRGLPAVVQETHLSGIFQLRRRLPRRPRVSLIVLGNGDNWRETLQYDELDVCDVVLLDGTQVEPAALHTPVAAEIGACTGDYLVFLDASFRPGGAQSITSMLEHLQDDQIAITGGTTRRLNGDILQAGLTLGDLGQPFYAYASLSMLPQPNFYLNLKDLPHEVAAVYAGCCAMRHETWRRLEGWNGDLPPVLAMSDLCLRALRDNYAIIYTPLAHFECSDELAGIPSVRLFDWAWGEFHDPFWNPNMNPSSADGLPFRRGASDGVRTRHCARIPATRPEVQPVSRAPGIGPASGGT